MTKQLAGLGDDDIANAERFVIRYGQKVIYSETRGYLVFDGKRHRPNGHLRCIELAKDVVKKIADEPPHLGSEETRARRAKFARESRSKGAIDYCWGKRPRRKYCADRAAEITGDVR